jgi:hypothetical protein
LQAKSCKTVQQRRAHWAQNLLIQIWKNYDSFAKEKPRLRKPSSVGVVLQCSEGALGIAAILVIDTRSHSRMHA